jgi:hypothetical protein
MNYFSRHAGQQPPDGLRHLGRKVAQSCEEFTAAEPRRHPVCCRWVVRRCLPADSVRCHLDGGRAKRIIDTSGRSLDRPPARKSQGIGTSLQLGFCLLYSHRCLDMSTSDMRPHFSPRNPPLPDDFDDDEAHDVSSPGSIIEADVGFCDTGCATRTCPRLSSAQLTRLLILVRAIGWSGKLWHVRIPRVLL